MLRAGLALAILTTALGGALLPRAAFAQWGVGYDEASDWHLAASIARIAPNLGGELLLGESLGATPLDVDDTLGLDSSDLLAGRAELKLGSQHLRFEYVPVRYEGDAVLGSTVLAFGQPFLAGDRVMSELGARQYRLSYRADWRIGDFLTLAPLLEVDLLDAWVDLEDATFPSVRVQEDVLQPVPQAGLRLEVRPLPRLELFAEGRGFRASALGGLADIRVYGGEAGASLLIGRHLALRGRYALDHYEVTFSDVAFDLRQNGPSLEVELRF